VVLVFELTFDDLTNVSWAYNNMQQQL